MTTIGSETGMDEDVFELYLTPGETLTVDMRAPTCGGMCKFSVRRELIDGGEPVSLDFYLAGAKPTFKNVGTKTQRAYVRLYRLEPLMDDPPEVVDYTLLLGWG